MKNFAPPIGQHLLLWQHKGRPCGENLCYFQVLKYLTEAISTEINYDAKFYICYERMTFVKHFGINIFDVLWMSSARALHVIFCK